MSEASRYTAKDWVIGSTVVLLIFALAALMLGYGPRWLFPTFTLILLGIGWWRRGRDRATARRNS